MPPPRQSPPPLMLVPSSQPDYGPLADDRLQAQAQRFLLELEFSAALGACNETPVHKVWSVIRGQGPRWPTYDYWSYGAGVLETLCARWQLDPIPAGTYVDYRAGEIGRPDNATAAAWADWLQMPLAVYCQLRDLVLNGYADHLWALADTGIETPLPTPTDHGQAQTVLDAARLLPPREQLYLIHRLTDSLQYHLGAVSEEDAHLRPRAPRMPSRGTYGSDDA